MAAVISSADVEKPAASPVKERSRKAKSIAGHTYPFWFYIPAGVVYGVLFLVPTFIAFYFSLTRWGLFSQEFIGFDNFVQFFNEPALLTGLKNSLIYGVITSALKVVLGLLLAVLLTSQIIARGWLRSVVFFPVLVSTIGIGITFTVLMHPQEGMINEALAVFGVDGPGWLTNPSLALYSVALVDVWKGVGLATVIYIAGIVSIPREYFEAAKVDGAGWWKETAFVTIPMLADTIKLVLLLAAIDGLKVFATIYVSTGGGPNHGTEVLSTWAFFQAFSGNQVGYGSAILVVLLVITLVLAFFYVRQGRADRLGKDQVR